MPRAAADLLVVTMTARRILLYGEKRLEAVNEPVTDFGAELRQLVDDLLATGWSAPGLGVAAPQIGVNLRLATIDLSVGKDPDQRLVLANPEIVAAEGQLAVEEGCLSFPGLYATISRPRRLTVRAQDEHGAWWQRDADGLLAQAVCHELDHLDGVLLVDHLRGLKRQMFLRRVERMRRVGAWQQTA